MLNNNNEKTTPMNLLEIDKITAARKLFNDATLLFYEKRSAILIHHLAHAAHEVLCAITGDSRMLNLVGQDHQVMFILVRDSPFVQFQRLICLTS